MPDSIISILGGVVVGAVAGAAGGLIVQRWRPEPFDPPEAETPFAVDPVTSDRIHQASNEWAAANDMSPQAADLIARKLRFGLLLADRRRRQFR